jgi:hypothetical protein
MEQLLSTNDAVLISYAETLLRDAGIDFLVTDQNMSVMEGSLGVLPRRLLVPPASAKQARQLLKDAGIGAEPEDPDPKVPDER